MKRKYLFKNTGSIALMIALGAVTLLSSCLKDTSPGNTKFQDSPAIVSFQYQGFNAVPYTAAILPVANSVFNGPSGLEITLSVASLTLKTPVTVNIVPDVAGADAQIAADTTGSGGYVETVMPTSLYSLPNGGKITINPGQQIVSVPITFPSANTINFSNNYVIGIKLTNAVGAGLTSNLNNAIIYVDLKSVYQGTYEASGVRVHPVLGDFDFDYDVEMSTVSANTVGGNALADLKYNLQLTVNPDNSVTLASSQEGVLPTPGLPNTYNPATKTFTLNYYYNTAAPRKITEKLVYVGP